MANLVRAKPKPIPGGSRSNDKAILVLLGLTGAGKTTTLNFLFDRKNIAKTESYCSATSTIMEYSTKVTVQGDEYDLRIIDTPGFGDTREKPHVRDARFVATFDNLLRTHSDLNYSYPTTILLVAKFNDDRIDGETSHFIQMLRALDTLLANYRLIDKEKPNLIFVLTHTLSEDNKSLQADPQPKIKLIECLVKTFTDIPTPIEVVIAENKPELYSLPQQNDQYKLPNGQYYPLNLFKKIQSVAVKANDQVGETIIREAFKDPSKISIQLSDEIQLFPENHLMVKGILKILQDAKFNIENTQISREIKRQWDFIDETAKKPFFNSLQITQSTFHKRKIFGTDDLPQTVEGVLKLLMDLPLNPPIISVIEAMGIVGPELPSSLGVGYFYNIFTDSLMTNSPFTMDALEYTEIGFRAARGVKGQLIAESLVLNSYFDDEAKYYQDRLRQLNIVNDDDLSFKLENFTSDPKEGYNIVPPKQLESVTKLTGVRETRLFRIYMKQPVLSAKFRSAVANLPKQFELSNRAPWSAFFRANGTHVVESVYAGGCIEVVAIKKEGASATTTPENVLFYIGEILSNVGVFKPMNLSAVVEDWDFKISFRGGDPRIIRPTLTNLFTPSGVTFFKTWTDSLAAHPVMLHSEICLDSVTHYLKKTNGPAAKELEKAMAALFCIESDPSQANNSPKKASLAETLAATHVVEKQSPKPVHRKLLVPEVKGHSLSRRSSSTSLASEKSEPELRKNVKEPDVVNPNQPMGWKAWFKLKFKK